MLAIRTLVVDFGARRCSCPASDCYLSINVSLRMLRRAVSIPSYKSASDQSDGGQRVNLAAVLPENPPGDGERLSRVDVFPFNKAGQRTG